MMNKMNYMSYMNLNELKEHIKHHGTPDAIYMKRFGAPNFGINRGWTRIALDNILAHSDIYFDDCEFSIIYGNYDVYDATIDGA